MAYSYVRYSGNGSTTNYTFSFPTISTDHIKVRVNGTLVTNWSFLNASTVQFVSAPTNGAVIEIRRETPKDSAIVNFTDGSVLLERDLDLLATYDLYLAQETKDGLDSSITQTSLGVFDGQNKRITNVADPVAAQDVVTKNWIETTYTDEIEAIALAAASSATASAGSATTAITQATNAAASAVSASNSAAAATMALDNFDDRYLGQKTVDPAVDNDGAALITGALYYNTTNSAMRVYTGSGWINASSAQVATMKTYVYVATAAQTTFTGNDANGSSLTYVAPYLIVSLNGLELRPLVDYTATSGLSVVLTSAATAGDELQIQAFSGFTVANIQADTVNTATPSGGALWTTVQQFLNKVDKPLIEAYPEWIVSKPTVTCYGDSFTMGVSGGITYDQSYVSLIAAAKNWNIPVPPDFGSPGKGSTSVGNQAFGGSQIASTEQIDRIMAHTTTDNDIQFILTGFNDMRAFGYITTGVSTYRQTLQAALAWMSIPASSTEKLFANSSDTTRVLRTGTGWTANTSWFNGQGYHTTIQGDAFNFTVFGDTIYMALPRDITTTGKCSITVDGVNYGTYDFSGSAAAIQYNKIYSMGFVRISGLGRGYHGVVLTKTSASGGGDFMRVDWVAGVDGVQSAQGVMGGPQVFVGNCCRMITAEYTDPRHGGYINGNDTVVAGYNTMIEQCVRELAADGLNITYVEATKYFVPNSPDLSADLVHPSAVGMQKIANAFLERMDQNKIHPKDRGVVDTGEKFINERWTNTSLGNVVNFGDESKTSMFGLGGANTALSNNVKLVEGAYFRINELKAAWQITLGDATTGPTLLYKAAGTGPITSWDKLLYLDGSVQPWLTPTLLNSWVNTSAAWTPARYLKDLNGFVHLGGLIGSGTIGAAAFVLPAGFRPSGKVGFPIVSNGLFGWVTVLADGTVAVEAGSTSWASLEGITFKAA